MGLTSDAISYYDHTKFFIEQMARGHFPLWDPFWGGGVPNDFFLRRIGPFNPFLLITLVLTKLGIKFFYAYMVFQVVYFFFGMTGFYLLARKVLADGTAAIVAFLVLLFSVLGTRMFDSYMLLVTIPTIWFFYFCVSFFKQATRAHAAGLTLALMFLMTTYIPLYFLIILLFFIVAYAVCYPGTLPRLLKTLVSFTAKNRVFMMVCAAAFCLAVLPGLTFFGDAGKGGIAIPGRHFNTAVKHVLAVESQQLNPWSIMEEFFFSSYYTDLTRIAFAIVYVPLFAFLVLGAGIFVRLSLLFVCLFIWAALIVLFSMPIGFPLYDFLYAHFGFIRYFRNLHFLLWFALFPIFALFVGEVWKKIGEQAREWPLWIMGLLVGLVHSAALVFLLRQGDALVSTYIALGASLAVWGVALTRNETVRSWILPLLLAMVIIQPVTVFDHLSANYSQFKSGYFYDLVDGTFAHQTVTCGEGRAPSLADSSEYLSSGLPGELYFTTDVYNAFRHRVSAKELERYEHYKFYLYDHPPAADDLGNAFSGESVKADTDRLRVVDFQSNGLMVKANLEKEKFVVFNDVNYPGWSLRVNGKPQPLVTSNGVFKGFWLPAGKSTAVLHFGAAGKYFLNWVILAAFYVMAFYTAALFWRRRYAAV